LFAGPERNASALRGRRTNSASGPINLPLQFGVVVTIADSGLIVVVMNGFTSNFYPTLAQVLPVLLLALIWDSAYLTRLRLQPRPLRRDDPAGVWFWTKPRVRAYILIVTGETIASIVIIMLVLAGLVPDSLSLRIALSAGLILLLTTIAVRIALDVIGATSGTPPSADTDQPAVRSDTVAPTVESQVDLPGDPPAA
jgi:hypothetical protein